MKWRTHSLEAVVLVGAAYALGCAQPAAPKLPEPGSAYDAESDPNSSDAEGSISASGRQPGDGDSTSTSTSASTDSSSSGSSSSDSSSDQPTGMAKLMADIQQCVKSGSAVTFVANAVKCEGSLASIECDLNKLTSAESTVFSQTAKDQVRAAFNSGALQGFQLAFCTEKDCEYAKPDGTKQTLPSWVLHGVKLEESTNEVVKKPVCVPK